jgi:NAD(P)-dependent dehydrogenase (short-subunit alcohol dehydrogenase family)
LAGKFALRSLSQTLAREYGPAGIHVAHVIVDGMIDTARVASIVGDDTGDDSRLNPDAIAETYWHLHSQHRSCWSQELDLRPYKEKF